jgi:hypothetical protein
MMCRMIEKGTRKAGKRTTFTRQTPTSDAQVCRRSCGVLAHQLEANPSRGSSRGGAVAVTPVVPTNGMTAGFSVGPVN